MLAASLRGLSLSAFSALLLAGSFPLGPPLPDQVWAGWWPGAWIALTPVLLNAALSPTARGAAGWSLLSGLASYGLILAWLHPFLVRWAYLPRGVAAAVLGLLAAYIAIYFAAFGALVQAWCTRWGYAAAFVLAPVAWVGLEVTRGRVLGGFPWCLLGYSQYRQSAVIQVADVGGVYAVSFLLVAGSSAAACIVMGRLDRRPVPGRLAAPVSLALLVAAGVAYGLTRPAAFTEGDGRIAATLIQANVPQEDKWNVAEREGIEARHDAMTREAVRDGSRLIVWSESSVPLSISHDPSYAARVEALSRSTGADILLGSVVYERRRDRDAPFNSAVIVTPEAGISGRQDKIRLVPFGEYVPLKKFLFFLQPLVEEASDFEPGSGWNLLRGGGARLGALICYEAIFPELSRELVRRGAEVLVNLTNDAWYGDTGMPRQHLAMTVFRAVENRRWVLRCANTGISAVIDPSGRIRSRAPLDQEASIRAAVEPLHQATLYSALGDSLPAACAILTVAFLSLARSRKPRAETRDQP